ncbi:MAG: hypothetical protein A3J59_01900 [Candidatus Buchananbacteria bacterium RIFCSPHIGHO2_02_FULL_56_16]|uniref:Glycoside hydrolase family 5 domain-containing protein n=1 Tax=Candidatus Buchananbacteria bacterium RIFCSPHIGHO2_02_FULL_56_16 TaxID=1797542 RepID=A0A1G1YHL2_9BACT|nr:MAG: hypothetical protein A3J59_01900 [Candidatus Buchananbacteria bacterium RIFCSPHIGHO2_02_FULL_56_16]
MKKARFKTLRLAVLLFGLVLLGVFFIFITDFSGGKEPVWGVTFSRSYALDLQLDWRQAYLAMLDELKISHLRLSAYWDELEPEKDEYNFSDLDWQLEQAEARGVSVILAVGRRLPRWPECHDPAWLKHYSSEEANAELLALLELTIKRYQDRPSIIAWQVENEPLFAWFGFCPPPDKAFFATEVALVRQLDPQRPVMVTDTGELSSWLEVSAFGDVVGTTLYRVVWNKWFGFWDYWFVPPAWYRWKADLTQAVHPNVKTVMISELQMEPWTFSKKMVELSRAEQERSFDLWRFRDNIAYVRRTGFPSVYLWGVEYWYWLHQQGDDVFWNEAKGLWQ